MVLFPLLPVRKLSTRMFSDLHRTTGLDWNTAGISPKPPCLSARLLSVTAHCVIVKCAFLREPVKTLSEALKMLSFYLEEKNIMCICVFQELSQVLAKSERSYLGNLGDRGDPVPELTSSRNPDLCLLSCHPSPEAAALFSGSVKDPSKPLVRGCLTHHPG